MLEWFVGIADPVHNVHQIVNQRTAIHRIFFVTTRAENLLQTGRQPNEEGWLPVFLGELTC